MSANFYELLKYAQTGIASPDMTYYDKMRASTLMGGAVQTLTGIPPLSFNSNGTPLISWSMKGNGEQQGTPTPDNPIMPEFVGTLDGTDWTIPITCAGQTVPVYLGQTQTVRRIRKLVLTGNESFTKNNASATDYLYYAGRGALLPSSISKTPVFCSHLHEVATAPTGGNTGISTNNNFNAVYINFGADVMNAQTSGNTVDGLKEYLAAQYANGTPVVVWYVLATEQTGIVNEPLAKIGTYADELHSEDAAVTIPTVKGANMLTVESELQPSEMTITYKG